MPRYKVKPEHVEAVRYDGDNLAELRALVSEDYRVRLGNGAIGVLTQFGVETVSPGDWVVDCGDDEYEVYSDAGFRVHFEEAD